jgi:AcrR family transcriptional regulator
MTADQSAPIWMRPERATVGRPAQYSRAEITAAALEVADREGLDAVSMRRVAADLGTGAASLYRYVETREELLDLMTDAVGAEYKLGATSGDWLADLLSVGEQSRACYRRHRWLAALVMTRPVIGPNGIALMEHVLSVLRAHPAPVTTKLEAFAMLTGLTAALALYEQTDAALQQRNAAYLTHALTAGEHPRMVELLSQASQEPQPAPPDQVADRYPDIMSRILTALLGPG